MVVEDTAVNGLIILLSRVKVQHSVISYRLKFHEDRVTVEINVVALKKRQS